MKNSKAYVAEFLGTFLLAFLVRSSFDVAAVPTPVVAGLTLGFLVYALGAVSGAHVNPAVTVGLASIGKISWKNAGGYVVSQLLGGVLALLIGDALLLSSVGPVDITLFQYIGEAIGAAILVLGVSSVVFGKAPQMASGLTIGTSLALGALSASPHSGGVLNPAVAIAVGAWSLPYAIGPLVGGIIAAWGYRALVK